MRTFACTNCNNTIYFENVSCLKCGHAVGFHAPSMAMVTLKPDAAQPGLFKVIKAAGGAKEVTIVGCGSSVGVEGKPMCYDIVSINPATQRWSVSFHHDERGDGSGFELQNVAIDLRTPI